MLHVVKRNKANILINRHISIQRDAFRFDIGSNNYCCFHLKLALVYKNTAKVRKASRSPFISIRETKEGSNQKRHLENSGHYHNDKKFREVLKKSRFSINFD